MKTLYFYLEKYPQFFVVNQVKEVTSIIEHGNFEELNDIISILKDFDQVIGLIPGEFVSILEVKLPIRSRKKATQALPFALEDQIAGNIDDLHFSLLDWNPGQASTVAIISREKWFKYLLWMEENSVAVNQIIPDFQILPLQNDQTATLFYERNSNRVLIKFKDNQLIKGIAISLEELPFWVEEFDAKEQTIACNDTILSEKLEAVQSFGKLMMLNADAIHDLCLLPSEKLNQIALYKPEQGREFFEKSKFWLIAGLIFLLLSLIVNIAFDFHEYRVLKVQQTTLNEKIKTIFSDNFPNIERIVDARLQFQREINLLQGNAEGTQHFLFLLESVVKSVPRNTTRVEEVFYRNSALNVTIHADNFQVLDRFTAKLDQNNELVYERISSDSQGGKVTAKYRLLPKEQ